MRRLKSKQPAARSATSSATSPATTSLTTSRTTSLATFLSAGLAALLALVTLLSPTAVAAPADDGPDDERVAVAPHFTGAAFDTCNTPSLAAMRGWRSSSYHAVGIYYGGRGRHCTAQPNLNRNWVSEVHEMGWQVLPVFVGSQAPCVYAKNKQGVRIGSRPAEQGSSEAGQAVREAQALGILSGSPLFLDMEAYDVGNAACARTTLDFVRAWNREVRGHGYLPGFYSSADSGVRQMEQARQSGVGDLPAVIWFARWHTEAAVYEEESLREDGWRRSRIHQYAGDVTESHGGYRLAVDRNQVDAPVARIG
ncbi:DUF1906 domain-containing protein [Streptomyces sp. NBC_00083]|uniref:DUF1906 domain-containing protein n=1 Tax=Streptomyces sp. NBC_00083 TaxID=2975647 RepID=UPI002253BE25|nr:DUF1906 domain-containing protein [Streptomyces sp. NBC_00083]MCX5387667.1 DUF1906 domain-containing protein [Streptomyces sp. NBC_00083]